MCARVVPRVQGVVYFTRSLVEMENETVVSTAIEYVTTVHQTKMPFRVSPPVLPLTEQDIEDENPLAGKFLRYTPTNFSSGCFIATITREVRRAFLRGWAFLRGSGCNGGQGPIILAGALVAPTFSLSR